MPSRYRPPLRELESLRCVLALQPELLNRILAADPELLVLIKGHGVTSASVHRLRSFGIKVINVFPDNPFQAASLDLVSRDLLRQFALLDRLFVHDRFAAGKLRELGVRAEFIAFARDPIVHSAEHPSSDARMPLVFIGAPDAERIRYLRAVCDLGLTIYGNWSEARLHEADPLAKCVRGGMQIGQAMVHAMRDSMISINILRTSQKTAHNMRTFETPACAVCSLSEASIGVMELMDAGVEVELFDSPAELRRQAQRLLSSPAAIQEIALAGRRRVEHETYVRRAEELLSMC